MINIIKKFSAKTRVWQLCRMKLGRAANGDHKHTSDHLLSSSQTKAFSLHMFSSKSVEDRKTSFYSFVYDAFHICMMLSELQREYKQTKIP